jgi:hypothetical protein
MTSPAVFHEQSKGNVSISQYFTKSATLHFPVISWRVQVIRSMRFKLIIQYEPGKQPEVPNVSSIHIDFLVRWENQIVS